MRPELKQFIQDNKSLINENTKESWEKIYKKLSDSTISGEFTKVMLSIGIDPAKIMGYIPKGYLRNSEIENYEIPSNVAIIGDYAFCGKDNKNLNNIKIPSNVKTIGYYAFYNCIGLQHIKIEEGLSDIMDSAFCGCESLKSIVLPSSINTIGGNVFSTCINLSDVEIKSRNIRLIQAYSFYNCTNLKEIKFNITKKEWMDIKKEKYWAKNSLIEKIICTDGEIFL